MKDDKEKKLVIKITLKPKPNTDDEIVQVTFPPAELTVKQFCDFFNEIDGVVDFWYLNTGKKHTELYRTIKDFMVSIEIPQGLPSKYPKYFDAETKFTEM